MHQLYQDSMAIVRKRGRPDLFITFTCNPCWKEIQDALLPGQEASDRPDLVSRVFYQKFIDMMHLLTKTALFGDVVGYVSVIEFQKRGLPHAHILLILANKHKPVELVDYNKLICAELPDKELFPKLYDIICRCNVHGPCGYYNPNSPCMIDGKCRFKYPRRFCASTTLDDNGYPTYMRRDDGRFVMAKGKKLDNRWIVPYNPFLSIRYKAHINVEICSTISAVKYLYKYIYKGHDRATVVMQDVDGLVDEIKSYLDARYVSSSEAVWRIYGFDLHREKPDVQRLQVHLPGENTVTFRDDDDLREILDNDANKKTTLTEWFVTNQNCACANELLYIDFPDRWVWNKSRKCWTERQKGHCIGRMHNIVPTAGDLYFLRMLLTVCKGSKSFDDLRTVNGYTYPTFKDACNARGMLQSDEEWMMCLDEASFVRSGVQLRDLFAIILVYCMPVSPERLWERFCMELSDDYFHVLRKSGHDVVVCGNMAKNQALANLNTLLKVHGKTLHDFPGMPRFDRAQLYCLENTMLAEETMYNAEELLNVALQMERELNEGQRHAYYKVLDAIEHNRGAIFFLDGPGGSGKTFVYNALLSRVRGQQKIALACASSGIAALLLNNGRTAHSRFKIPIVINNDSTCNIKVTSDHAELLKQATLIVWDEAPMTHRHAFEAVDRTLRDIMQKDYLFGGKIMLFGGDFRQVLPVVPKGHREDIIDASLCRSFIWKHIEILQLTENMRLVNSAIVESERDFAKWVLDIGNGNVHANNDIGNGNVHANNVGDDIILPPNMLLDGNCVESLIDFIYGDMSCIDNFVKFFKERGILAAKNKDVDIINSLALCKLRGANKEYLSADSVCSSDDQTLHLYTLEFLNSLDLGGGFPPHVLNLKENAPVMLLRNLDPRRGLCNGTRLICKQLYDRVIEAEIITGKNAGDRVLLPRIDFISSSSMGLPFEMRRRQFPIKLAFGMTINKAQGQTLGVLGLYLASPVFSHGQLYVAMSRVRSSNGIKIVVDDKKLKRHDDIATTFASTPNIVFKEVLQLANARI